MPTDRDKKPNRRLTGDGEQFTLESILAEFRTPQAPPDNTPSSPPYTPEEKAQDEQEKREEAFFFPPNKPKRPPEPKKEGRVAAMPGTLLVPTGDDDEPTRPIPIIRADPVPPKPKAEEVPVEEPTQVIELPTAPPKNPVDKLRQKADAFAAHMYEDEGKEQTEAVLEAEALIPGVDEEEAPTRPRREKKARKAPTPPPDVPPAELFKQYSRGFSLFRFRVWLVLLPLAALLYLTWDPSLSFLPPETLILPAPALRCYAMAALQAVALLLGADVVWKSLVKLVRGRLAMDAVCTLANLAALVDALTLPSLQPHGPMTRSPFSGVAVLTLWCVLWGTLQKRRGQRLVCRAAALTSEPYLVSRDEGKWNNRDTYTKWSGSLTGFSSQVQGPDGAERIYKVMTPIILIACLLFSLISSVGRERSQDFFWCLAAILTAACPLSATLCFGLPWRRISTRLYRSGAALAGWQGVINTTGSSNLLLTDIDLFPAGSVTPNGIKVFGSFPLERVVGLTATVIRDSGSGLTKVFHDLLRSQGAAYRKGDLLTAYEGGGVSEVFGRDLVQVGSASFMVLMDVSLPAGLKVPNAVFCAINGELAGIFALNYQLPNTVLPALDILIRNKITPVLCTRDFNLIPSTLRQRFKLPAEKMEFPPVDRRRELSDPRQSHSSTITAILCRESVGPFAEAVVAASRLRTAVRLSTVVACLGAVIGSLLAFYLTFVGGYASLTPANLIFFLLMWTVPTLLIDWWVDKY